MKLILLTLFNIMMFSCSMKKEIVLNVENKKHFSDTEALISIKNISKDEVFLYKSGINNHGYLNFNFSDSTIKYGGNFIQLGMPFGTVSRDSNSRITEDCERFTQMKCFIKIPPDSTIILSVNLKKQGYFGFQEKKKYKCSIDFEVDKQFEDYCSKIWTGRIRTRRFNITIH